MMHPSLLMVEIVARRLGALRRECVFVGGATVPLFLTEECAPPRSTKDVDVIVELSTRAAYYAFSDKLRQCGFQEDTEANILCRWKLEDLIVDVMPTEPAILGFSNQWYAPAIAHAQNYSLAADLDIRLVTAAYFIATKIEAFGGRGLGDFLSSRDIEDIVAVIDGRAELRDEIAEATPQLQRFIAEHFAVWLSNGDFLDALAGHLLPDAASQNRLPLLVNRMEAIAALA